MSRQFQKPVPEGKDPYLWEIAQKRASFKSHLITYILVNTFLWAIWYFSSQQPIEGWDNKFPWPIWPTLGWGIGLAFHFAGAYIFPEANSIEKEYEKLSKKNK
ncbi:MAG: 2TM domain-containing protein [Niastella sp.]|nr:2TM domain-containing protein [Niastella sp.]